MGGNETMENTEKMLVCSNLKKKYFKKTAMENITLELGEGRIYALLGPNGSGKTTFMKTVAGLVKPTEGTVLYKNQPIGVDSKKEVSYMPTENYFYPYMTVEDVGKYYQDFFEDSLAYFEGSAFELLEIDRNYCREGEPMTAYQARFYSEGKPINYAKYRVNKV